MTKAEMIDDIIETLKRIADRAKPEDVSGFPENEAILFSRARSLSIPNNERKLEAP